MRPRLILSRFLVLVALLASLFTPLPSAIAVPREAIASAATTDCVVYATRTGHKYHEGGCRYLKRSSIRMSLKEARARGFAACSVCGGSGCD
jgi:hypothetical protein